MMRFNRCDPFVSILLINWIRNSDVSIHQWSLITPRIDERFCTEFNGEEGVSGWFAFFQKSLEQKETKSFLLMLITWFVEDFKWIWRLLILYTRSRSSVVLSIEKKKNRERIFDQICNWWSQISLRVCCSSEMITFCSECVNDMLAWVVFSFFFSVKMRGRITTTESILKQK